MTKVYNKTVINNVTVNRVSFNGGNGVRAQPTSGELAAARDRHIEVTSAQRRHEQTARANPELRAAANQGRPPIAATPRAGNFSNPVPARNAPQARLSTPHPTQQGTPNRGATPNREAAPNRGGVTPGRDTRPPTPQPE